MAKRDEDFGRFGDVKPVGRGSALFGLFKTAVGGILLAAMAMAALKGWSGFFSTMVEREPPKIKFAGEYLGVGVDGARIDLIVSDDQSGIAEVIIRTEQGEVVRTKQAQSFDAGVKEQKFQISLSGLGDQLEEGKLQLIVSAYDNSYWRNFAQNRLELIVDLSKPQPSIVGSKFSVEAGNVGLIFYQLPGEDEVLSGVTVGSAIFPGFPAKAIDPDFAAAPELHFALFTVPRPTGLAEAGSEPSRSAQVFARDPVGNSALVPFDLSIVPKKGGVIKRELSRRFFEERVELLYQKYLQQQSSAIEYFPAIRDEELVERFLIVEGDYRKLIEQQLQTLFTSPKQGRFWKGVFSQPGGTPTVVSFGTEVQLEFASKMIANTVSEGEFFTLPPLSPIRAVSDGVVIYADDLGFYGNCLILDHGLGLSSFYTNVGKLTHREGDRVSAGDQIAVVEPTGFAWEDGYGFQMRIHGRAVNSEQWFNQQRYQDSIAGVIAEAKKAAGVPIRTPLGRR